MYVVGIIKWHPIPEQRHNLINVQYKSANYMISIEVSDDIVTPHVFTQSVSTCSKNNTSIQGRPLILMALIRNC